MQDMSPTQPNDPHDTPQGMIDSSSPPSATPASPPSALPRPATENSQLKFVPADEGEPPTFEPLPPEIANADIFLAPDGSFVETSSGAAARELKRRYDQYLGVGKDVRSPYAITAFVNQHGKQMYRVGHRELSAPAASGQDAEDRASTSLPPSAGTNNTNTLHMKRRSRMSVHAFLPVSVFKSGVGPASHPNTVFDASAASRSPPTSRRLRKTRSIPNGLSSSGTEGASAQPAPQPTGRPHAHSVSSADAFAPPITSPPQIVPDAPRATVGSSSDFFADVMSWSSVPTSPFASSSSSLPFRHQAPTSSPPSSHARAEVIANPFGRGVSFESPSWRSPAHLSSPPVLREMQSFESGLTARADYLPRMSRISRLSLTGTSSASDDDPRNLTPPPGSATPPVSSSASSIHSVPPIPESPNPPPDNLAATTLHSRYSTALFDVLQTYRGLPTLDKLVSTPGETTIRLSLRAEDSAAPRDDPRFVIWAEVATDGDSYDELAGSSTTDLSSANSQAAARRRAGKERVQTLQNIYAMQPPPENPSPSTPAYPRETKKMLVAATIERWIAQLTSELNYDELLIFFLTYRTYISAVDLGHLLICRFHWALGETTTSRDEMVRKIVRVRTFTAIRYWLLTFFDVDFVPNRELRTLFAEWLNSLRRDPILTKHRDALKIVRQLRKVILDCKDAHMRKLNRAARKSVDRRRSADPQLANFADTMPPRPSVDSQARSFNDPEDFDIDFDFEDVVSSPSQDFGSNGMPSNALDLVMMRQPLHMSILQYGKQNQSAASGAAAHPNVAITPYPHSTISRVFVNTIGRLGRWKRVLNSRGAVQASMTVGVDVSAFDVEANETGDLLLVKGGVEQYLRMVESQMNVSMERPSTNTMSTAATAVASPPAKLPPLPQSPRSPSSMVRVPAAEGLSPPPARIVEDEEPAELPPPPSYEDTEAEPRPSMSSYSSTDNESLRSVPVAARPMAYRPHPDLDIVSIDDLDLSDLSSDENIEVSPPPGLGLKKAARKLPTRRDFEFVRQSMSSVSSMGIRTRESMLSRSSIVSSSSEVEAEGEDGEMGGPIQAWQLNAILDSLSDDGESGDVEAALRRLEGQINQDKVKEKQSKVDQWIQSMHHRQAGQFSRESTGSLSDEEDYGQVERRRFSEDSAQDISIGMSATSPQLSSRSSIASMSRVPSASTSTAPLPSTSATSPEQQQLSLDMLQVSGGQSDPAFSDGDALTPLTEARPLVEDAVPLEILQSRVPSRPSTSAGSPAQDGLTPQPSAGLPPPPSVPLKRHHSFVLNYRAETLMQHLSMIDRELFLGINFEELITPHAVGNAEDANILDWSHFLRERARLKAEGRGGSKTSALTAVRGRFNLVANFVLSEIVLTHPSERAIVINKFIRLAWKAYLMKNFTALVAIIAGLRSEWVAKAKQQAFSKIGTWEARMLRDLTDWTASAGDFKHIRQTVDSLVEARSSTQDSSMKSTDGSAATTRSRAASDSKPPSDPTCIPFFGVYLAQLHHYSSLPDLIDPTAPHEPVGIDPETNTFESLAHPEVFSTLAPLPASMQLEPLINVHKQRLIAGVVKSLVAGQHLAAKVQYPLDKKIFQKCLKLRGLDGDTLERALMLYTENK
ncbi:ras GEF [Lentinus tigrinus ALCF2SS1-6]|uniref:Ras GEF n=1 Tax=Lentinus tigrinus ALCF2SS1-6 TaxID=1328759 RepID=A0A5C2SHY4_9APHY|nr:ras GEF [Lentinus tigrinus ALCF2SS1-6]